jgi:lipopolysaccharide/colanic/teichoic acid biosynthesis glycosyltransferase
VALPDSSARFGAHPFEQTMSSAAGSGRAVPGEQPMRPRRFAARFVALPYGLELFLFGPETGRRAPRTSRLLKRVLDVVLASLILALTAPLMAAAAVAVAVTSPGGVFYRQERYGLRGETFEILKFRSMVNGADRRIDEAARLAATAGLHVVDAPVFKSSADPRITRVGRWLRRTNIDELPQLFNILAGSMSLVGPRPLVPEEGDQLSEDMFARRHSVRPGLTGLWQVVRRETTTFEERMGLDALYARRRSIMLDLVLIVLTPLSVVRGAGSY